jgi:hypothetical protein
VTAAVATVVVAGLALAAAVGASGGLDALGLVLLAGMVLIGALGIAAARRVGSARIGPRRCQSCVGVNSANAPFCKHCGAPQPRDARD